MADFVPNLMKQIVGKFPSGILVFIILTSLSAIAVAQFRLPINDRFESPVPPQVFWGRDTTEKSIKVDNSIILELCVAQGSVRVNGWNRSEVRVFVEDGNKFSFNIRDKDTRSGHPNWVNVVGYAGTKDKKGPTGDCISGNEIEIDIPVNATIKLKGHDINTTIDSIRKAEVKTGGGDISLRNIKGDISAFAGQGDIFIESSTGPIAIESTTGNIVVFDVGPGELGDPFKARTNSGTISLQSVQHRQVDVGSTSGSVSYSGSIRNGGRYNLFTVNGSIRMAIPPDSACKLSATFGSGRFISELAFDLETENNVGGPIKTIAGKYGKGGDAEVKLTASYGSISVRKL